MTHLWSYRGKAQPGIPAIDSKFHYLNHFDVFGDIVALYNSRIYDQAEGSEDIAGTILALWHDRLIDNEWNLVIENGLYPNMLAIAERAWRGGGTEYLTDWVRYFHPKTRKHSKNSLILKSVCCGIRSIRLKDILSPM